MTSPDPYAAIKAWALDHPPYANRIQIEACRMAQSAAIRRLALFGVEDALSSQSAAELAQLLLFVDGPTSGYISRLVFARAIIEERRDVLALLAACEACAPQAAWLHDLERCDEAAAREQLASVYIDHEEQTALRLVLGRRFPHLLQPAWLFAAPLAVPRLAGAFAQLYAERRSDLASSVLSYLEQHRAALMAQDPDLLLAPVVRASSTSPHVTLAPFADIYGDASVVAAAEWHLEHQQPSEARTLAKRIRALGPDADRARLICVIASVELGEGGEAVAARQDIAHSDLADQADLAVARLPGQISDATLVGIAQRCQAHHAERFLAALTALLQRRRLDLARSVARECRTRFAGHPVLDQVFATVLPSP